MENSILKLLEEGGSDDIRLGYQLLKAVDQPTIPALALWKEVFRMVEEAGEIELFLHHVPKFKVSGCRGFLENADCIFAASALTWPNLRPVFDLIERSQPSGRLSVMAMEVSRQPPISVVRGMTIDSFKKQLYEFAMKMPQPREYDWGPLGFPQAISDEIKRQANEENQP